MELYKWQKDCLTAWEKHNYQGIVNAVTGSGKTQLALSAIRRLMLRYPELRVRIVAPTIALANQWRQSILRDTKTESSALPGFYGNGIRDDANHAVMIYVVNSAREGLAKHVRADLALHRPVLLICDECHRYLSRENFRMFEFIDRDRSELSLYHCLGLSATPFTGENNEELKRVLGNEIYSYDFEDAAQQGTISPFTICQISATFFPEENNQYELLSKRIRMTYSRVLQDYPHMRKLQGQAFMRELKHCATVADMNSEDSAAALMRLYYQRRKLVVMSQVRIRCCVDLLYRIDSSKRIIIFSERIEQAEELQHSIHHHFGGICGIYHSQLSSEARKRNLNGFKQGMFRILITCRALDEGLDVPDASVGIVLSSSKVSRQRIQRLGRILRRSPDKDIACLYYIYISNSGEDAAYLPFIESTEVYDLHYFALEKDFSNDFYTYAAAQVLAKAISCKSCSRELQEIRRCIQEGLCRPDYLLPEPVLKVYTDDFGKDIHRKNYWHVMLAVSRQFRRQEL